MIYWDTSAIITLLALGRLGQISGITRPHTLAEFYARSTGKGFISSGRTVKLTSELAAHRVQELSTQLRFILLSELETAQALCDAAKMEIRGGRTHDFLHFVAAKKARAKMIYTFNTVDFAFSTIPVKQPPL